jgi:hypothetical protein
LVFGRDPGCSHGFPTDAPRTIVAIASTERSAAPWSAVQPRRRAARAWLDIFFILRAPSTTEPALRFYKGSPKPGNPNATGSSIKAEPAKRRRHLHHDDLSVANSHLPPASTVLGASSANMSAWVNRGRWRAPSALDTDVATDSSFDEGLIFRAFSIRRAPSSFVFGLTSLLPLQRPKLEYASAERVMSDWYYCISENLG